MKKVVLVFLVMFISLVSTNASTGNVPSGIKLEDIKITSKDVVSYNGAIEVEYELIPRDADSKDIIWSVSTLESGVTVNFVDGNKTNKSSGKMGIQFKNETKEVVKVFVTAKNGNVSKKFEVSIESEEATTERVTTENVKKIEDLINELPKEVNNSNYNEVESNLEKIDSLIYENKDIEKLIDEELIDKYDYVIEKFEEYEENSQTIVTIVTIVLLVLSFILGLFVIFKKEKK